MALEGSLSDFGLSDILQLIYFQRKTGVLTLAGKMDSVKLMFIDGNITGAESKRRTDDNRLGRILVKKGFIKDEDLQAAIEEQKKTGSHIGSTLINRGLVSKEIVGEILKNQVSETVIQLFSWKQGTYDFSSQDVSVEKDLSFSLDTEHLLMEGLRVVDEWSVIRERVSLDAIFRIKSDAVPGLSDYEKELVSFVDGENDVSTIIDLSGKDSFELSRTLLALVDKGVIEPTAPIRVTAPLTETVEAAAGKSVYDYLSPLSIFLSFLISVFLLSTMVSGDFLKTFRASAAIEELRVEIETYRLINSAYPETPISVPDKKDPWGRPYIYSADSHSYTVFSTGPDGRQGTDDDIY